MCGGAGLARLLSRPIGSIWSFRWIRMTMWPLLSVVGLPQVRCQTYLLAKELFAALSARWLAVSRPVLERYDALMVNEGDKSQHFRDS